MTGNVSTKLIERVACNHARRFTPEVRQRFLQELQETTSVRAAADACGLSADMLRMHKRLDPDFSSEWEAALDRGFDPRLRGALS